MGNTALQRINNNNVYPSECFTWQQVASRLNLSTRKLMSIMQAADLVHKGNGHFKERSATEGCSILVPVKRGWGNGGVYLKPLVTPLGLQLVERVVRSHQEKIHGYRPDMVIFDDPLKTI